MIRERLRWGSVNPGPDRWELDGDARYDALRKFYRQAKMPILELAHDSPVWLGRVGKYPQDLIGAASSWSEIGRKWSPAWGGLETWNEPDIFFGGDLPADQYAAVSKAIGFGLARAEIHTPIVGGVMANLNREFLETCAGSGLLDRIDAFSFHTYGTAEGMRTLVQGYREWLARHGHGGMPLWITECGRPWSRGPDRPPIAEDQKSARDIIMKGVEAKACGIARYFAFVYPYYEENDHNFGMTDRSGTPLRSFAAYAQLIRVLANQPYLGDLRHAPPEVTRARVFGNERQAVVVLYTGDNKPAVVRPPLRVRRVEGIDGRVLKVDQNGGVPIPDGLSYVWLDGPIDPAQLDPTAEARARPSGPPEPSTRPVPSPIVLRLQLDPARFQPSARGYRLKAQPAGSLPLKFEVWNLGDTPRTPRLRLSLEPSPGSENALPEKTIKLAAKSSGTVDWTFDAGPLLAREGRLTARLTARDESGAGAGAGDRLAVVLSGEAELGRTLGSLRHPLALPIRETKRWTPNHSPGGSMVMDSPAESAWRLRVKDEKGADRWAYPFFLLPENVHLEQSTGLLLRARCSGRAAVRVLLFEGDLSENVVYLTANSIIPDDGRWHVARVAFRDLAASAANAVDPDGRLDLARVRHLGLGVNSRSSEATLEVSDLYLIGEPPTSERK